MMVILKIPVAYLCFVVYLAIRAEPRPLEGAALPTRTETPLKPGGRTRSRFARPRPTPPRPGGRAARIAARAATASTRGRIR